MIYWELFSTFFKIGLFSFGGGYAMLSMIEQEIVRNHSWITIGQFTDIIAVSQITPGPIAINSATYIGYITTNSILGSICSTIGVVLPSIIVMSILIKFIKMFKESKYVEKAFIGLRPTVIGLILGAAFSLMKPDIFIDYYSYIIFLGVLIAILKYKVGVVKIIIVSAILGILLY
ncbi:MAG: chromate transporter [Fusobacteriaceae bacterium]